MRTRTQNHSCRTCVRPDGPLPASGAGRVRLMWALPGSNRRPVGCKPTALPTELNAQGHVRPSLADPVQRLPAWRHSTVGRDVESLFDRAPESRRKRSREPARKLPSESPVNGPGFYRDTCFRITLLVNNEQLLDRRPTAQLIRIFGQQVSRTVSGLPIPARSDRRRASPLGHGLIGAKS